MSDTGNYQLGLRKTWTFQSSDNIMFPTPTSAQGNPIVTMSDVVADNITINENATIEGTTTLTDVVIDESLTLNGNLELTGDLIVEGNLELEGNLVLNGSLDLNGNLEIEGNLEVDANITCENATVNNTLKVNTANISQPISATNIFIGSVPNGANSESEENTVLGMSAGIHSTSGNKNTLVGYKAGNEIRTGVKNTLIGMNAGANINTASNSVCIGFNAGANGNLTTSGENILIGMNSDVGNASTTGSIAIGYDSTVTGNTSVVLGNSAQLTGSNSIALGLDSNSVGSQSIFMGSNVSANGDSVVVLGDNAIVGNSVNSNKSIAIGKDVVLNGNDAIAFGNGSSINGSYSIAVGSGANVTSANSVAIGASAVANVDNTIVLGTTADTVIARGPVVAPKFNNITNQVVLVGSSLANSSNSSSFSSNPLFSGLYGTPNYLLYKTSNNTKAYNSIFYLSSLPTYTPVNNTGVLYVEFNTTYLDKGNDESKDYTKRSLINFTYNGDVATNCGHSYQYWNNKEGGGTRSGTIFPITGIIPFTNANTAITIDVQFSTYANNDSDAGSSVDFYVNDSDYNYPNNSFGYTSIKITELSQIN